MTPSQTKAVAFIRSHIEADLHHNPEYRDEITEWDVKENEHGTVSVWARNVMVGLPEGNLLRVVSAKTWMFFIGRGGKIVMVMGPDSYKQFMGRGRLRGFGFHVQTV